MESDNRNPFFRSHVWPLIMLTCSLVSGTASLNVSSDSAINDSMSQISATSSGLTDDKVGSACLIYTHEFDFAATV